MIKTTTLLAAFGAILLFSCNRNDKASRSISERNTFINARNAYSDFFFDSSQLVAYIAEHNLPDSISQRMTGFYNTRNYQFAWFSSAGVTEQGRGFWNMYKYYLSYDPGKVLKDATFTKKMDKLVESQDSVWQGKQDKFTQPFHADHMDVGKIFLCSFTIFSPYLKCAEMIQG